MAFFELKGVWGLGGLLGDLIGEKKRWGLWLLAKDGFCFVVYGNTWLEFWGGEGGLRIFGFRDVNKTRQDRNTSKWEYVPPFVLLKSSSL